MMTSDLAVPAGPLDMGMSLGGVCFRSLGMSLGHVLVAPLGFPAAVGEANALDVAPQTEGLLVLGQSSLRNHVFLLNGGFGGDKGDADGGGNDQSDAHICCWLGASFAIPGPPC